MVDPLTATVAATAIVNLGTALWKGNRDIDAAREQGRISEDQARALEAAFEKLRAGWQLPPGEAPELSPVELELVGQFSPEIAKLTVEQAPQMVPKSGMGRDAQLRALDKLGTLSTTGNDAISSAAMTEARFAADADNQARQQRILSEYANRGLLTGATGIASQLSSAQDAAAQQYLASQQAAAQAQQRRVDALSQYGNMAGQIRQSDDSIANANAEIMNMYNQRLANSMNEYNRYKAATLNTAQQQNLKDAQRISDANRTSATETKNLNIENDFNAQTARRNAQNDLATRGYNAAKDVVNTRTQGKSNLVSAVNTAGNNMIGGAGAAITGGAGQLQAVTQKKKADSRLTPE